MYQKFGSANFKRTVFSYGVFNNFSKYFKLIDY